MPKLVLIDGHFKLHRAYHGIDSSLTNSKGMPTGAIYTFATTFLRHLRQLAFEHVAVVFDPPGKTFREEYYPEYKAHRPPMPEDLRMQEKEIRRMLDLMGLPVVQVEGCEADDVMATLAIRAAESGGEALIISVDKDLLQVVRPGITILREHQQKSELLDVDGVVAKMGLKPEQVPAYLGLLGDASDNIPGVPGVGDKTAVELLKEFGTMENVLANAAGYRKKKVAENLVAHAEDARLSERLATIKTDCPVEFDWERFRWEWKPTPELVEFFREMEFGTLLKEVEKSGVAVAPAGKALAERTVRYETIATRARLDEAVAEMRAAKLASIDTETTDLDPMEAELVGIALSWGADQAAYVPVGHGLSLEEIREGLRPALADPAMQWVAHHWGYDCKILRRHGFQVPPIAGDTMLEAYLVNPERSGSLRLKDLALEQLGIRMTQISELIGDGADMITMASVSVEDSSRYACQDADATRALHCKLMPQVEAAGMAALLAKVELPLVPVLASMEDEGVRIDREHFRRLSEESEKKLHALAQEIYAIAGRPFKINSPKQVAELLFEELKLPAKKRGKSGAFSTDESVLEELEELHPLPAKLLEYRGVEKLKNTYIDKLPNQVHLRTGRVHTKYSQAVAATGRLASSDPNLQNIPIRTAEGRAIRRGFIPRAAGWRFVSADYSQIELRILAHLSKDAALCEAFRGTGDIHTLTASKVFGVAPDAVAPEMRAQAKAVNFGIIYGMSQARLARDLGVTKETAKKFMDDYFRVYSGVKDFIEATKAQAARDGFVTTLLGRRRFIPDIQSRNAQNRGFAERIAVNTPIQGTSADMIKAAMIRVAARIEREGLRGRMILQVHDELIFDVPEQEADAFIAIAKEEMAAALPLDVPVRVDASTGANWEEC